MPYAYRVTRVTISGSFMAGIEEWSTGFYMGKIDGDAALPTQAQADDVRDAWGTFFNNSTSEFSSSWTTSLVKLSSVGTDTKSNAADTVFSNYTVNPIGKQTNVYPPQISLVATMASNSPRGIGAKGRMYLPGIAKPFGTDGKIAGQFVDAISTNFKTFLDAVNASTNTDDYVILASQGQLNRDGTIKVGGLSAVNRAVTSIRLGNVYDTQRRRRNGLQEQYQVKALVNQF
jgi:hypothetical protein